MSLEATITDLRGNEEDWKELVTKTSQPETGLKKRARRTPPSAPAPADRERVVLIKQRIELDFGSLDVTPLIAGVALSDSPIVLDMRLDLAIPYRDYYYINRGEGRVGPAPAEFHNLRLTGIQNSAVLIQLCCNKPDWSLVYEIRMMKSILYAKKLAGWYQRFTTLTLSLDHRGELAATLEYKITGPLQAEYSRMSVGVAAARDEMIARVLPHVCPNGKPGTGGMVTANEFIECLYTTPKDGVIPYAMQHESLQSELLQFQRRAVLWMLRREGVEFCETTGKLVPYDGVTEEGLPPTFNENVLPEGEKVYVSHILGVMTKDRRAAFGLLKRIRGGLLAEEMGLGKTVELMALMLLHQRQLKAGEKVYDEDRNAVILAAKGTLVVVPTTLVDQWKAEIEQHAPSLKCFEYKGIKDKSTAGWGEGKGALELQQYDVVLTTYSVLSSELHFTEPPPERKMRNARVHVRKTSPLLDLSWWRVCLDEAQMVDGGFTNASKVARRIPRVNAWAVSGTPLRRGIEDVRGLMLFLKIEPFADNGSIFKTLIRHNSGSLESIFRAVGMRHTKEDVQDEINLPPQKRIVISIPFTPVEAQNYDNLFAQMCKECGFDENGKPLVDFEWKLSDYAEKMRGWLIRLRQTCTHPETGIRNKKAFGGKPGGLRTMVEVLEVMVDRHLVEYRNQERELCNSRLSRARMMIEEQRQTEALEVMHGTLKLLAPIVAECRATVAEELKGEERQKDEKTRNEYQDEEEDEEDATNPKKSRLAAARLRLRHFVDLQHACYFWIATASHQLTEEDPSGRRSKPTPQEIATYENSEVEYYDKAKSMRMELLAETREKAVKEIDFLKKKAEKQDFILFPDVEEMGTGGIESQTILDNVEGLAELLNDQAELLDDWREKLITLLTKPVFDSGTEEDSGSELVDSVKESEEIFSYMLGIKLLLANREQMFTGIKNHLAAHEVEMQLENPSGVDIRILSHLSRKCSKFQSTDSIKPMKHLLSELHRLANRKSDSTRSKLESAVAAEKAQLLQKSYDTQVKLVQDALSKEARIYRNALNAKMDYYRQLQYVSDTVSELDLSQFGVNEITPRLHNTLKENELKLTQRIATAKARGRYFAYLQTSSSTSPECLICLENFDAGVLTSCGHAFCKRDLKMWWSLHRNCPSCKTKLQAADFYEITFSPLSPTSSPSKPRASITAPSDTPDATTSRIYTPCDRNLLRAITATPLTVSYGSKIDLLTRHLLYLTRHSKPPLKAVIFSQWKEVLDLLSLSLSHHNISFASPAHGGAAAFRANPAVPVFLLHARSQSSGLTLVNATHVFLIEPLLNIPLESQAVSRVHRIGQSAETTVWVYTVEGTVEESVLGKREERGREDGEGAGEGMGEGGVFEGAKECVDKGGEVVAEGDLWDCLFGARRKDERGLRRELMAGAAEGRVEVAME